VANEQMNNSFAGNAFVGLSFIAPSPNNVMINSMGRIIDSGASNHMTPHAQIFSSI